MFFDGVSGWVNVTVGEVVSTMNVTGELVPVGFPSELGCVAIAVYCPFDRGGLTAAEAQLPPVPCAVTVETSLPSALLPL